jgi:hypothetical protein
VPALTVAALALAAGCGDDGGRRPADGSGGSAGSAAAGGSAGTAGSAGASGSAGVAGEPDAGGSAGAAGSGADAGVPDPIEVGDAITGNASSGLGEVDPERNRSTACLHVDWILGEYRLLPGDASGSLEYEPVLSFVKSPDGFEVFGFFPWAYDFVVPEIPPRYVPVDEEALVSAYDGDRMLEVAFTVADDGVVVHSVVVTGLPGAP